MAKRTETLLEVAGREVRISSPDKPWFPEAGLTKLDVVQYWLAVGEGALRGVYGRPMALERFVKGATQPPFYQKRAPKGRPDWVDVVTLSYPSGRTADEVVVTDLAQLLYVVNLGCFSLHPHPVRADDLDHPDELRIDLDPVPGVPWSQVREVALVVRDVLAEHGLVGWPKTSGKRGLHVLVRLKRRWPFEEVKRAAQGVAREVARRVPDLATARWWKEERQGVFLDYNQNARDHTVASAYSVRATPTATVSMPLTWDEVPGCEPERYTVRTAPELVAERGFAHAGIDGAAGELSSLLALAAERQAEADEAPPPAPKPVLIVAESEDEDAALAGLERWRARYPEVAALLAPHHVLNDKMRGRSSTWTRIRVNLEAVPEDRRPPQETPDPDDAPQLWGPPAPRPDEA